MAPVFSALQTSLVEQVKRWQAQGLCVGFTNGCFDLLHAGHLHSLREAKKTMRQTGRRLEQRCLSSTTQGHSTAHTK